MGGIQQFNSLRACCALTAMLTVLIDRNSFADDCLQWSQTQADGLRENPAMVFDSNRNVSVLFGGNSLAETWEWNGTSWSNRNPLIRPTGRSFHAMAYDSTRHVTVLFGGHDGQSASDDTWEWDGTNWTQRTPTTRPPARFYHAMAYDSVRNVTLLYGGSDGSFPLGDTWVWNGIEWHLQMPPESPGPLSAHAMAFDTGRGVCVLFGGANGNGGTNTTWEWNGMNWVQRAPNAGPPARYRHSMAFDSNRNRIVMFGGFDGSFSQFKNDLWEWNGTNWVQRVAGPVARMSHAMAFDDVRGVCIVYGGQGNAGILSDTWEWNGAAWLNRTATQLPPPNIYHAISFDSWRNRTIQFGGITSDGYFTADTWEWDGKKWSKRFPTSSPPARICHAMAFDSARGVLVLFGGTSDTELNDTWEWDGIDWQQRFALHNPPTRSLHSLAYDSARGVVVLFGGAGATSNLSDTWEWDGEDWIERTPAIAPVMRSGHCLSFDSHRNRTVLFGGSDFYGGIQFFGDTWEWDGMNWHQQSPTSSPPSRFYHAMVYDSVRGVTVIQGGLGNADGATWEWDGSSWTKSTGNDSLLAREWPAMTFDCLRGNTVLFGGRRFSPIATMNDTLEWDGKSWTQKSPITLPLPRTTHAMTFDKDRNVIVMFGGFVNSTFPSQIDMWERKEEYWTQRRPPLVPSPRYGHSLTFADNQHATILYGGASVDGYFPSDDMWKWDGKVWTELGPANRPPRRHSHAACYDSKRGVLVVFGGSGALNDTWEWDGITWEQKNTPISPSGNARRVMAFDPIQGVSLLIGGNPATNQLTLWRWDGIVWEPVTTVPYDIDFNALAMAFDYRRNFVVVYGEEIWSGLVPQIATNIWDGVRWHKAQLEAPQGRYDTAMVYDSFHDSTVLFGGRQLYNGIGRNWLSLGDTWDFAPTGPAPTITQHPASPAICQGSAISLHSTATGDGTLSYQWRKNGIDLTDDVDTFGTQSNTLAFAHAAASDAGTYDCVIKLNNCTQATSNTATLSVFPTNTADGNLDGLTDARDIAVFVDALTNFAPVSQPLCAYDLTGEGIVNPDDIPPFVTRLLSE